MWLTERGVEDGGTTRGRRHGGDFSLRTGGSGQPWGWVAPIHSPRSRALAREEAAATMRILVPYRSTICDEMYRIGPRPSSPLPHLPPPQVKSASPCVSWMPWLPPFKYKQPAAHIWASKNRLQELLVFGGYSYFEFTGFCHLLGRFNESSLISSSWGLIILWGCLHLLALYLKSATGLLTFGGFTGVPP